MRALVATACVAIASGAILASQRVTTATITGTVVDGISGDAVPDATVTLSPVGNFDPIIGLDASKFPKTQTDASGRFRFDEIKPAEYWLRATKAGYWGGSYGARNAVESGVILEVAAGSQKTELRIRIWRGAVITGKVEDENGKPLVKRDVVVLRRGLIGGATRWIPGRRNQTTERGQFRLADLSPGEYVVAVPASRSGEPDTGYPTTFFPDVTSISQAITITLGAGEKRSDVVIRSPGAKAFVRVSGQVVRPDGSPLAVAIHLVPAGPGESEVMLFSKNATSAADGTFLISDVPPGSYRIELVDYPKRQPLPSGPRRSQPLLEMTESAGGLLAMDLPIEPIPDGPTLWAQMAINVGDQNLDDVRVVTQSGLTITGTVAFRGASPRPDARTLMTRPINVRPADRTNLGSFPVGPIGADGRFRTVGLPPGRYVMGMVQRFEGWSIESITVGGREIAGRSFELTTDIQDVVVTLSDRETEISGLVRDEQGKRMESAWVFLFPEDRECWTDFSNSAIATRIRLARPKAVGTYRMTALPGKYYVAAISSERPELWETPDFLEKLARVAVKVSLDSGAQIVQNLTAVPVR